jgi:hypothetical protein
VADFQAFGGLPLTLITGKTTVTTAGTRVQLLTSSTPAKSVTIKALIGNTGHIYVGNNFVSSTVGFVLEAGDTVSLNFADLSNIWLDCSVNGEGVTYLGVN